MDACNFKGPERFKVRRPTPHCRDSCCRSRSGPLKRFTHGLGDAFTSSLAYEYGQCLAWSQNGSPLPPPPPNEGTDQDSPAIRQSLDALTVPITDPRPKLQASGFDSTLVRLAGSAPDNESYYMQSSIKVENPASSIGKGLAASASQLAAVKFSRSPIFSYVSLLATVQPETVAERGKSSEERATMRARGLRHPTFLWIVCQLPHPLLSQ